MQIWLQVFTEKHNTSRHYMWRFITDLSAVINTEWAEKKIKIVPDGNQNNFKNNFRTIIQNLKTTSLGQIYWVYK